jgi:NADH:ubiquinone oxidoreductase subunit 6 (subunit J)
MRFFDYIYYCVYRYVLKTPGRTYIDAWPNLFLALTLFLHAIFGYGFVGLMLTGSLWPLPSKLICGMALVVLMIMFYWYYNSKGNGSRVIRSYEKRDNPTKYARLGAIIVYEGFLLPFIVAGVLIVSQKLTGWPPHP